MPARSSFNNFWGVPLTLCNARPDASLWVVEMGMNQAGEIARLSELTRPTVALVVNVQPVHLEKLGFARSHPPREGVDRARPARDGVLVLPAGIKAPDWKGKVIRSAKKAEVHEVAHAPHGESWQVVAALGKKRSLQPDAGRPHRVQNALAALASIRAANLDAATLAIKLDRVGIMTGRGVEQAVGGVTVIDDSFNGNPASVAAALQSLQARTRRGRRIAVLGDMLELGDGAPAITRPRRPSRRHRRRLLRRALMRHLFEVLPAGKGLAGTTTPSR